MVSRLTKKLFGVISLCFFGLVFISYGLLANQSWESHLKSGCDDWDGHYSTDKENPHSSYFLHELQELLGRNQSLNLCRKDSSNPFTEIDRVVLVVYDAVRFDFVNGSRPMTDKKHYHDVLDVFYKTAKKYTDRAKLIRFIADYPTVTTQRIIAILSGTIPKFIKLVDNFGGTELKIDNFVSKLHSKEVPMICFGDEIWRDLFPKTFRRSDFYESFDVHDWTTNDNGVDLNTERELFDDPKRDWKLMIAHFLGVDHVGHAVKANSPEMETQLEKFNKRAERILEYVDANEKTMAIFISDHGMLENGNHAGSDILEIESFLFSYVSKDLRFYGGKERDLLQTALTSTISAVLGIPISYLNTGYIAPELLPLKSQEDPSSPEFQKKAEKQIALYKLANSLQIARSLKTKKSPNSKSLQSTFNDLLALQRTHLKLLQNDQTELQKFKILNSDYSKLNQRFREAILNDRKVFDNRFITVGFILLAISLLISFSLALNYDISAIVPLLISPKMIYNIIFNFLTKSSKKIAISEEEKIRLFGTISTTIFILIAPLSFHQIVNEKISTFFCFLALTICHFWADRKASKTKNLKWFLAIFFAALQLYFSYDKEDALIDVSVASALYIASCVLFLLCFSSTGEAFEFLRLTAPHCPFYPIFAVPLFWAVNSSHMSFLPETLISFVNLILMCFCCVNMFARKGGRFGCVLRINLFATTMMLFLHGTLFLPLYLSFIATAFFFLDSGEIAEESSLTWPRLSCVIFQAATLLRYACGIDYTFSCIDYRNAYFLFGFNYMSFVLVFLWGQLPFAVAFNILLLVAAKESRGKKGEQRTEEGVTKGLVWFNLLNVLKAVIGAIAILLHKQEAMAEKTYFPKFIMDLTSILFVNIWLTVTSAIIDRGTIQ